MLSIQSKILNCIHQQGQGWVFTPRDFVRIGTRQSVDTALSRLVDQGCIRRLTRGLYDYPKKHSLLGNLLPSLDDVAKTIAKDTDTQLQISGARALYLLGLSSQVPAQTTYLTNGRSKELKIGSATLRLKHSSSMIMAGAGTKAGTVLQAIRHIGKTHMNDTILSKIAKQLSNDDIQGLKNIIRYAPGWTKPSLNKLIAA